MRRQSPSIADAYVVVIRAVDERRRQPPKSGSPADFDGGPENLLFSAPLAARQFSVLDAEGEGREESSTGMAPAKSGRCNPMDQMVYFPKV